MNNKYYLVGAYKEIPVYYSKTEGLLLCSGTEEFEEPTELQRKMIVAELGGMKTIEQLVNNYERTKRLEAKQNDTKRIKQNSP